jgi:hypothetical protein
MEIIEGKMSESGFVLRTIAFMGLRLVDIWERSRDCWNLALIHLKDLVDM